MIEVVRALEDPKVWDDARKAQDLGKERRALEETLGTLESIDSGLKDSGELYALARGESDDATLAGVESDVGGLARLVESLEFRRMFSHPMDPNNCFLDINAGQGGTEAHDWTQMLLRMYGKY